MDFQRITATTYRVCVRVGRQRLGLNVDANSEAEANIAALQEAERITGKSGTVEWTRNFGGKNAH